MVEFVLGRAATGKTSTVYKMIEEDIKSNTKNVILLVPEQNTFETEKRMLELFGDGFMSLVNVLSFTRLCDYAGQLYGGIAGFKVNDAERTVFMGRALKNMSPHLTLFKKYSATPSFIKQMTRVITEFKIAGVTADELVKTAEKITDKHLAEKLIEISMVYSSYNELLKGVYIDPLDELENFYQKAVDKSFFKDKTVYIDAFKGFTGVQIKILKLIINSAKKTVFTFCLGENFEINHNGVFSNVAFTADMLENYAKEHGCEVKKTYLGKPFYNTSELYALEKYLAEKAQDKFNEAAPNLTIGTLNTAVEEVDFVFKNIHKLVREEGYRFRDFVLIARDISKYERRISLASKKFQVPCFFDKRHILYTSPVARFVISILKSSLKFETDSILSLVKTRFFGLTDEDINSLEEYVFIWDIKGEDWLKEWTMNPEGFVSVTEESREKISEEKKKLNEIRSEIINRLLEIQKSFSGTALDISKAVYKVLIKLKVDEQIKELCLNQEKSSEDEDANFIGRSWDAVMNCLDSIVRCYGDAEITPEEYINMLEMSFCECSIGNIPRMVDEVSCGSADRIRPARPKIVFVIGLNLSEFPKIPDDSGILLRNDRTVLSEFGFEIADRFKKNAIDENFLVYSSLCCATEKVFALCHNIGCDGEKCEESPIITELKNHFSNSGKVNISKIPETLSEGFDIFSAEKSTGSSVSLSLENIYADSLEYKDRLLALDNIKTRIDRKLSAEVCEQLFGKTLRLSPSKIEVYSKCPLSYFCKYVLYIKKLQKAELDVMQRGTVVHFVLEQIIKELGNSFAFTEAEVLEKSVEENMQNYLKTIDGFEYLNSELFVFIYNELCRNIKYLIKYIAEQFKNSDFVPVAFELEIDDRGGEIPSLVITFSNDKKAILGGKIDRVDVFKNQNGRELVRIVDYKTNSKSFYLSDVFYGQNMQMLLYLYMINSINKSAYKDMEPAGILYMPSKRGTVTANDKSPLMMNGMILDDTENIAAMDKEGKGKYIFKKSSKFRRDNPTISAEDFNIIFEFLDKKVGSIAKKITEGDFSLRPCDGRDRQKENACAYCDFKTVCAIESDFEHDYATPLYPNEVIEKMKEAVLNGMD